jgi:antitoxin HicB
MNKRQIVVDRERKFAVVLEPEEEGGFTVRVPALPEIVTYGRDEEEALAMAEDAIRLVLEDMTARGEPIPPAPVPHIREVTVILAA